MVPLNFHIPYYYLCVVALYLCNIPFKSFTPPVFSYLYLLGYSKEISQLLQAISLFLLNIYYYSKQL